MDATHSRGSCLFRPFLHWFVPYFNTYSFPLARAAEYAADATAVALTSPTAAAQALSNVSVTSGFLEDRYWPQVHGLAAEHACPAVAPFSSIGRAVASLVDAVDADYWLRRALATDAQVHDTHPALADRLQAIGAPAQFTPPAVGAAADGLLGNALARVATDLDQRWSAAITPAWAQRYEAAQQQREQLAALNARVTAGDELSIADAYTRARLSDDRGTDPHETLLQFRALYAQVPDHAVICLNLGACLLRLGDPSGAAIVERAMTLDAAVKIAGCELLRDFHARAGRMREADSWQQRRDQCIPMVEAARRERNELLPSDRFAPHALTPEALAVLRTQLASIEGVRAAWLVRKQVEHFPDKPCYVLAYATTPFYRAHDHGRAQAVLEQIKQQVTSPGETIIVNVEGAQRRLRGTIAQIARAQVR